MPNQQGATRCVSGWQGDAAALGLAASQAMAADKVTLQLKWVTQAQFAGYYVAKDKGFYGENLDAEIKAGGPDIALPQVIAGGGADVIIDWIPRPRQPREGPAAGQHRPAVQELRHDADLPEGYGTSRRRLQGQDPGRLVLRQRVSVPLLDVPARHPDRGAAALRC